MVEGICDKILAYSNSGIWSVNRILSPMIMISVYSSICTGQQRLHTKNPLIFHAKKLII